MKTAVLKSYLRSLFAAAVAALGTVLTTSADLTLKVVGLAVGAAVLPVIARWLDSSDEAFGRTDPADAGLSEVELVLLVLAVVGVFLLVFGVFPR